MTVKEMKVYQCGHCKKRMLNKGAMSRHENICSSNPENWRACMFCKHIEEIEITYELDIDVDEYRGPITKTAKGFHCKKLDKKLYPFKAEKKNLPKRFPETFEGQEPMPKTCEFRTEEYFSDQYEAEY